MSGARWGERMHPCAESHDWDSGRGSMWARCRRCDAMTKLPPPPGAAPAPPAPAPMRTPPPAPDVRAGGKLTAPELGLMRQAARWGLLRPQSRRRFMLTGLFSMTTADLGQVIEEAGGRVDPWADIEKLEVDVLVVGEDASEALVAKAYDAFVEVWDEADLVAALLPTIASLEAGPGQAPF